VIDMLVGAQQRLMVYPRQGFMIEQEIPDDVAAAYRRLRAVEQPYTLPAYQRCGLATAGLASCAPNTPACPGTPSAAISPNLTPSGPPLAPAYPAAINSARSADTQRSGDATGVRQPVRQQQRTTTADRGHPLTH
jgi:hypothetical protein